MNGKIPGRIDPHVHCRDGSQAYKETISHCIKLARSQGVWIICDMPNTNPPIIDKETLENRLELVPRDMEESYRIYLGLTPDPKRIEQAIKLWDDYWQVVGFKLYAGKSVGDLAITNLEEQRRVYQTLSELGYNGVVIAHCEREDMMKHELFDPARPESHAKARPREAEIVAVSDQIKFALEEGFKGHLHITHASLPEVIDEVDGTRESLDISVGVTPHHVMWDASMLARSDGLIYKMNPPLRKREDVIGIRERILAGKVDWIETDHAPHPVGEKLFPPYFSGFPSLYIYRQFVEGFLPELGVSSSLVERMTRRNILDVFREKLRR